MGKLRFTAEYVPDELYSMTEVQNWFVATIIALRATAGMPDEDAARYAWKSWEAFKDKLPKKDIHA